MRLWVRPPWIIPERTEDIQFLEKTVKFLQENTVENNDKVALKDYQEKFGLLDKFHEVL